MTSAISAPAQNPLNAAQSANAAPSASGTTSPLQAAVPAQPPVRSYASATKTATPTPPTTAGAPTPAQHGKPNTASPVNSSMAAASQASGLPNGTPTGPEHGKKPSVVISASGTSGYTPNGGPVGQNSRPSINFGSMGPGGSPNTQASAPYQSQGANLSTPAQDPRRVISPSHSPSPIPQPAASGGRPPSIAQGQSNGLSFGSMGGENGDQSRPGHMSQGPLTPGAQAVHLRRESSQSAHSDVGNPNMQNMNRNFAPNGRGQPFRPQGYGPMASPGPNYRQVSNPSRGGPNMPQQFQGQGQMPPGSPYGGRNSPAFRPAQPHMPQGHMAGNPQMQYGGYPQHLGPQHQAMYGMPQQYDPYSGYYQPYYNHGQYPGQGPSQSPRPGYPGPFGTPQNSMQPPFHPPSMSRSASQVSERPASSMGQPQTPSVPSAPPPSSTPANSTSTAPSSSFVRPKKSSAIKITNEKGEAVNFAKPSPSPVASTQPQTPVIVSTPNAPTPPPRAPSGQHNRAESKAAPPPSEETKTALQEQFKRQVEENRRKEAEELKTKEDKAGNDKKEAAAKVAKEKEEAEAKVAKEKEEAEAKVAKEKEEADAQATKEKEEAEAAQQEEVKKAAAEAEKAAAAAAHDKEQEEKAAAAAKAASDEEDEKNRLQKEEDERLEREIAEMEALEREEEEREKAYQEKKRKQKEEQEKRDKESAVDPDAEMKRLEREAEEREEAREREREEREKGGETVADESEQSDEAKALFASLKKPTLGPGASAPESGAETPVSDDSSMPPPQTATTPKIPGTPKPRPANLKLDVNKKVEPAEPTAGMKSLKSARIITLQEEVTYPSGFQSPNPAINQGRKAGRQYDKDFLLQFQTVFKEKPAVDWEQKVKDTLGSDEPGSARAQSARTPSSGMARQPSGRPQAPAIANFAGPMGHFVGGRTLPQGTTSEQRFMASQGAPMQARGMGQAFPAMNRGPPGPSPMSRTNSVQTMGGGFGPNSPRQPSSRGGKGGSKRDGRQPSRREEADMANKMPLTAHMDLKPLEKSKTGWQPTSITGGMSAPVDLSGMMAPDMVQRKVKAALNKMTPEKFDKISDQVLEIAGQSKNETDGRTLRQVIALTFEKACDEAHWASMYAKFCQKMLATMSTDIKDETITDKTGQPVVGGALFRKYLLNRCQEEFERGWEVNLPEKPEGDTEEAALLSDEYYIAAAAKRRGLGLIQFIGELYKLGMLTVRIMAECVQRLLNFEGNPDEAAVESLTKLLTTVGETMDSQEQGHGLMNAYFDRIQKTIADNKELASRPRFMAQDLIDLRRARWHGKGASKGPKTIQEIHEEAQAAQAKAEMERQRTNQRGPPGGRMPQGRGDARNFSGGGMAPPVDYSRTTVGMDDLRRLQNRGASNRNASAGLGPGGSLGPGSSLGARTGSRRGLGPASGSTTRTNTPPVEGKDKKDEPSSATNAFSALAALDGAEAEAGGDVTSPPSEAASPPNTRTRSKSPAVASSTEEASKA